MSDVLLEEHEGSVLILTLNRPQKRNALSVELLRRLHDALDSGISDDATRVMVLTGRDPAFCAGLDLNEIQAAAGHPSKSEQSAKLLYDTLDKIYRSPKPVIAAVNGSAVAGGAGLMSVCDLVIAAQFARIGYPEIKRGLTAAIVMPYLVRQVGERRAKHLLLVGELITASEAREIGLVNEVVLEADLMMRTMHLSSELADYPPEALALTKKWMHESQFLDYDQQRDHARKLHTKIASGAGAGEGAKRFLEAGY